MGRIMPWLMQPVSQDALRRRINDMELPRNELSRNNRTVIFAESANSRCEGMAPNSCTRRF
jgi:hypothetical protein